MYARKSASVAVVGSIYRPMWSDWNWLHDWVIDGVSDWCLGEDFDEGVLLIANKMKNRKNVYSRF